MAYLEWPWEGFFFSPSWQLKMQRSCQNKLILKKNTYRLCKIYLQQLEYWTFSAGFSYVIVCIWIIFEKEIYPEPSCILILFLFYYQGTLIHWHSKYQKLDWQTLKDFLLREQVMKGAVIAQKLLFYAPSKCWEELLREGGRYFQAPPSDLNRVCCWGEFRSWDGAIPVVFSIAAGPEDPDRGWMLHSGTRSLQWILPWNTTRLCWCGWSSGS